MMDSYFERQGLNSGTLRKFNKSPDHCLMQTTDKPYFVFGRAFEDLLQDKITGSNLFSKYMTVELGEMPKAIFEIVSQLKKQKLTIVEIIKNLSACYIYNKDGITRNRQKATYHAWLDLITEHGTDKEFLPIPDYDAIQKMSDNMLTCEYEGIEIQELLKDAAWQKEIYWSSDMTDKKAKIDCSLDGMIFDVKTTANLNKVIGDIRFDYWIQDRHYTEGAILSGNDVNRMPFLVASKEEPYLCQPIQIAEESLTELTMRYERLVSDYLEWDKQPVGHLPKRDIYI